MVAIADHHRADPEFPGELDGSFHAHVAGDMAEAVIGGDDAGCFRPADVPHVWPGVDPLVQELRNIIAQVLKPVGDGAMQVRIDECLPSLVRIVPRYASGTEGLA